MDDINYVNYIIKKKEASNYQIENAINKIRNLEKNYLNYILLSKLYIKKQDYLNAKEILNKAKEINPYKQSLYYNLFITNIYLEEYKEAYNNLKNCDTKGKNELNNTVIYYLLEILNEEKENKITRSNIIRNIKIKDKILFDAYNMFIDLLENKKYKEALNILNECKKISNVNFDIEIKLLMNVIKKQEINKEKIILNALINKNKAIKENDIDKYLKYINILFNNNYATYNFYLKDVNYLINFDINESIKFLNKIEEKYKINDNFEVVYLKNKIKEKQENKSDMIEYFIKKARNAYQKNDLKYALVIYYLALESTRNNIFNYYIGKIEYKLKKYKEAKFYLNKYIEKGSEKYSKSLLYLGMIEKKDRKNYSKYIDKMNIINEYEKKIFELDFNMKDRKILKKIKINEEEFRK